MTAHKRKCPGCGANVPHSYSYCPRCGEYLEDTDNDFDGAADKDQSLYTTYFRQHDTMPDLPSVMDVGRRVRPLAQWSTQLRAKNGRSKTAYLEMMQSGLRISEGADETLIHRRQIYEFTVTREDRHATKMRISPSGTFGAGLPTGDGGPVLMGGYTKPSSSSVSSVPLGRWTLSILYANPRTRRTDTLTFFTFDNPQPFVDRCTAQWKSMPEPPEPSGHKVLNISAPGGLVDDVRLREAARHVSGKRLADEVSRVRRCAMTDARAYVDGAVPGSSLVEEEERQYRRSDRIVTVVLWLLFLLAAWGCLRLCS